MKISRKNAQKWRRIFGYVYERTPQGNFHETNPLPEVVFHPDNFGFVSTQQGWRGTMDWRSFTFQEWGKWLIFGDAQPAVDVPVTLWARAERVFMNEENGER